MPNSGSKQDSTHKPANIARAEQLQRQLQTNNHSLDKKKTIHQMAPGPTSKKNKINTDTAGNSLERGMNIQIATLSQVNIKQQQQQHRGTASHNKGSIPPQLDTSSEILKIGSLGLQNMKKLAMPLSSQNKELQQILPKDNKIAILKNILEGVPSSGSQLQQVSIQIQNNTFAGSNLEGKFAFHKANEVQQNEISSHNQGFENSSKSPSSNARGNEQRLLNNQQITKVLKGQIKQGNSNFEQAGIFLNSERILIHPGSSKLSLSHEFPNSSSTRECEMSTTINYTNVGGGIGLAGEAGTSQTMVLSNVQDNDNSSLMGNSPHNQTLNGAQNNTKNISGSSILQRRAAGSSQHIASQLAPSQAKRRHYLKTGSVNQRTTTEENTHSSPSTGGGIGVGQHNNAPNSTGNKSQHYGLSSQSFLTNSNNSGSQPRDNQVMQNSSVIPGPSSARLNSSSLGSSFYNHQRQKSGGFFQQVLQGNIVNKNAALVTQNTQAINVSLNNQSNQGGVIQAQSSTANTATLLLKKPLQNNLNQVGGTGNLSAQNQDLSFHHSIKATLSGSSLNQAQIMTQQLMHNTISTQLQQKLSLSSRPQYQQQISSGNVILKNKSKSSIKDGAVALESSRLKSSEQSNSSRSNSIKKRTISTIFKQSTLATAAKNVDEIILRNNFMVTSADEEEESSSPINHENIKQLNTSTKAIKNTLRKSLQHNRQQYNNTVEEVGADLQNTSSLSGSQQNSMIIQQQLQQSFNNDPRTYNPAVGEANKNQVSKGKEPKKSIIGPGMNRSVIVEPTQMIISNRGGKRGALLQKTQQSSDQKTIPTSTQQNQVQGLQEFESMKQELKSKDMLIQNLRDRLLNLEEKVNGIQITQQVVSVENQRARNNRTQQDERSTSSERARDKSQQRIKEAIINLERKLDQFRMDKDLNHLRLQEIKQYSSSQHSSSRQSEQHLQLQNQKSLQQHLQSMIDAGLLHSPQACAGSNGRPQTYLLTSSSNDGGFATHTLGGPPRKIQKSPNSLIEDLESLITVGENNTTEEALAAAVLQRDRDIAQYYLEDFVGDGGGSAQLPLFYDGGLILNSCGSKGAKRQHLSKIKTPMFENPMMNNNIQGGSNQNQNDEEEDELNLFIRSNQDHEESNDNEEQDNSCLLMLEKEWQEAQKQKMIKEEQELRNLNKNQRGQLIAERHHQDQKNMSQLFDQSLIIEGGGCTNPVQQQQLRNNNNLTQNNIVFFFDEDTTLEDGEDLALGEAEDIAMAAQEGREKFVKTQKIEFSNQERISLGMNFDRKKTGRAANRAQHEANSLSPTSSDVINVGNSGGGGVRQQARKQQLKPSLNVVRSNDSNNNKQGQTSTNQAIQIQTQQQSSAGVGGPPTFSRTLSKTTLLAKIRNALGKNATIANTDFHINHIGEQTAAFTGGQQSYKKKGASSAAVASSPKKAQPRRFIIKRSQERNASTSNNNQVKNSNSNYQQVFNSSNYTTLAIQPLKLKTKVTAAVGAGRPIQDELADKTIGELHNQQQQEQLMKTIVQQKEKIALTQKDAIKKERELSLKLSKAIQKLNMKIQIQQTSGSTQPQSMAATQLNGQGSANKKGGAK